MVQKGPELPPDRALEGVHGGEGGFWSGVSGETVRLLQGRFTEPLPWLGLVGGRRIE